MACSLCVLVVALPLVVLIGAAVVRVAVWLANRVLGRPPAARDHGYELDEYVLPPVRAAAIPAPEFAKAVWITIAVGLASLTVGVGLAYGAAGAGWLPKGRVPVGIGSTVLASAILGQVPLLKVLLPTTFLRASLVSGFVLLLGIPVAAALGGLAILGLEAIAPNLGR